MDDNLPLTNLLKKELKFKWGGDCRKAFQKNYFAEQTSIDNTRLAVSDHATEAKLLQSGEANAELSIAYFPKVCHNHPKNYSTMHKDILALTLALLHFEAYVFSKYHPLA